MMKHQLKFRFLFTFLICCALQLALLSQVSANATIDDFVGTWGGVVGNESESGYMTLNLSRSGDLIVGSWVHDVKSRNISGTVANGVLTLKFPNPDPSNPDCANFDIDAEATLNKSLTIMILWAEGTFCGTGGGGYGVATGTLTKQPCTDVDGDGYYAEIGCGTAVDCDNTDAFVYPGAIEICDDGIDQNCDGHDETRIDAPTAPRGLAANAVSYRKILLRWTDKSSDEDGFKIERKKRGCASSYEYTQITTVQGDNKYEDVNFEPDTQYSYRVRAYNGLSNSEYSNCGTTVAGISGTPSAPVNLVATCVSSSKVDLTWDEWSTNMTEFKIYRNVNNSGSWTLLATTGPTTFNYSDTKASGNQSTTGYCYYVQACNDKGCSPPTYTVCMPFNPTSLTATAGSNGRVVINWTDNSSNERGFEIYRKTGNCSSFASWEKVKLAGIDRTTVSDKKGLISGTTYAYKIRAYCRSWGLPYVYGYSDWSNCVSITAP